MTESNLQEHWHSVPNHMTADIVNPMIDQSEHNEAINEFDNQLDEDMVENGTSRIITYQNTDDENKQIKLTTDKIHNCPFCDVYSAHKCSISRHILAVHEGKKPYICELCGEGFSQSQNLAIHISTVHEKNKPYHCDLCGVSYAEKRSLKKHSLNVHKQPFQDQKPLLKKAAVKKNKSEQKLEKPNDQKKLTIGEKHKCQFCNVQFLQKCSMTRHILAVHEGKKPHQCEICNASFSQHQNLVKHTSTVHEKKKPFKCEMCQLCFAEKGSLKKHVEGVHEKKKPFACTSCEARFISRTDQKTHILSVHERKRPFPCTKCSSAFTQKCHLKVHMSAVHAPKDFQKPHACPQCDKRFLSPSCVKRHISSVHTEKIFECSICFSQLKNKKELNKHYARLHEPKQENLDLGVQNVTTPHLGKPVKISEEKIKTEPFEEGEEVPKNECDIESKFNIKIKNEVEDIEEMQEVHSAVQPIWIKEESQEIFTSNDHYQDPLTEFNNDIKKENT